MVGVDEDRERAVRSAQFKGRLKFVSPSLAISKRMADHGKDRSRRETIESSDDKLPLMSAHGAGDECTIAIGELLRLALRLDKELGSRGFVARVELSKIVRSTLCVLSSAMCGTFDAGNRYITIRGS